MLGDLMMSRKWRQVISLIGTWNLVNTELKLYHFKSYETWLKKLICMELKLPTLNKYGTKFTIYSCIFCIEIFLLKFVLSWQEVSCIAQYISIDWYIKCFSILFVLKSGFQTHEPLTEGTLLHTPKNRYVLCF